MMPFQRIVVGVDFSSGSLNAVRWLAGTFAPGARIFVVHVVAQPRIPPFLESVVARGRCAQESALYPGLRAFAGFAGGDPADAIIAHGNPSVELARIAADVGADLVCVGRTRRRRGSGRFGATTPQRLLAHTDVPMLIVPESAPVRPGAVLAAVSGGRDAADVLHVSCALAGAFGVRLDALHALEPEIVAFARGAQPPGEHERLTTWRPAWENGESAVAITAAVDDARLCALARDWITGQLVERGAGRREANAHARVGDAGEEVVAHAARNGVGLIVTGRLVRHHPVERLSRSAGVGSTTRLVTWATSCPVLVLGSAATRTDGPPLRGTMRHGRNPSWPLLERAGSGVAPFRRAYLHPPDGGDAA